MPYYPKRDDVVQVKIATRSSSVMVLAKDIDHEGRFFRGHELRQVRGSANRFSVLPRMIRINCSNVLSLVPHRTTAGCIFIGSN